MEYEEIEIDTKDLDRIRDEPTIQLKGEKENIVEKKKVASTSFIYWMNKEINHLERVAPNVKVNDLLNPFSLVDGNSKDGSVVFNHSFKSKNKDKSRESAVCKNRWMYQTSPKYNKGVIDHEKVIQTEKTNNISIKDTLIQNNINEKDEILKSIKSIHSRIDSIHSVLSAHPVESKLILVYIYLAISQGSNNEIKQLQFGSNVQTSPTPK